MVTRMPFIKGKFGRVLTCSDNRSYVIIIETGKAYVRDEQSLVTV